MSAVNSALFGHCSPAEALPSSCQSSPDTRSALMALLGSAGWWFIRCSACIDSRRREAAGEVLGKPMESDLSTLGTSSDFGLVPGSQQLRYFKEIFC